MERHRAGNDLAPPARRIGALQHLGVDQRLRLEQTLHRNQGQRLARGPHTEQFGEPRTDPGGVGGRDDVVRRAALQHRAPEQTLGARHAQQVADGHGARGLAEHGDAVGVAAEGADVVPHPGERGDLVAQAEVGGVVAVAEVEEPVGARPPVDRHAHHTVAGEAAAVVAPAGGEAEGAARTPHHHRKAARSRVGRPDVQVEAVVAGNGGVEEHAAGVVAVELRLRWLGTENGGVTYTAPRLDRLRRSEPVGADGRRGVRDAQKRMDSTNGAPRT